MADKDEKSSSIPWLPLIGLIGVSSGFFLVFTQLSSSRPVGGETLTGFTFDNQTVDARLWQDPLGVAAADWKLPEAHGERHTVKSFQELLVKKCFTYPSASPAASELMVSSGIQCPQLKSLLDGPARLEAINSDYFDRYLAMRVIASSQASGAALLKGCVEQVKQLQILAVMVPGGPYVEDVERRIRSRRAVSEGLGVAGYAPEREHEIGYFYVPWHPLEPNIGVAVGALEQDRRDDERSAFMGAQPVRRNFDDARGLLVPYEWYEPAEVCSEKPKHVLVVWLTDDGFRDAPIARLADLILRTHPGIGLLNSTDAGRFLPIITLLGPDNSGTLRRMVEEAKADVWDPETRKSLATTQIYSSQATAAESELLSETDASDENCKKLIEGKLGSSQPGSQFAFERTIPSDDKKIVEMLQRELECRGVEEDDHIAIISEEDTYYARAFCSVFKRSKPPLCIRSYTYLRGIDGKLPSDKEPEKEANGAARDDKNSQSSRRPTEQTEGLNQADDIRRLAQELQEEDRMMRDSGSAGLRAVGVLGSDVYDKLELLKALRPILPQAVFFTNNLDARLGHPDEWAGTHNLVVVSAMGLALPGQEVPPFRDSAQTALFSATLKAMRAKYDPVDNGPHIFEIGRNGPKELDTPSIKDNWWTKGVAALPKSNVSHGLTAFLSVPLCVGGLLSLGYVVFCIGSKARLTGAHIRAAWTIVLTIAVASTSIFGLYLLFGGYLPRLLRIGYFVAFASGLLAWKYLVSRVTSTLPNTSSQAEGLKNEISFKRKTQATGLGVWFWDQRHAIAASSWLAVPICAMLTLGLVCAFHYLQAFSSSGEPFALFDGISAWPSVAIILFAGLLSIHLILKAHFDLRKNASDLTRKFGLQDTMPEKISFFGWEKPPLKPGIVQTAARFPAWEVQPGKRIDIAALWQRYLRRGQLWMRMLRAAPMTVIYMAALLAILPIFGDFPRPPIRGPFAGFFVALMMPTIGIFLFLTFFVIDAIVLHEGFLNQLREEESCWPDATFKNFNYSNKPNRPPNETDLADYWDILLIARRTEAVGGLIYYPFIILSLLILARLSYFDNWNWPPVLVLTFSLHFALAFYAAWRLPKVAREYRDKVLERLKRRKRQALMLAKETPQAIETMIEEVQSTHQGAFSNLWEQPAIRALLFPSSGIGIATLLQYLPH